MHGYDTPSDTPPDTLFTSPFLILPLLISSPFTPHLNGYLCINPGRESGSDREGKIFGKYTGVDISRSMLDAAKTVMQTVKASPLGNGT